MSIEEVLKAGEIYKRVNIRAHLETLVAFSECDLCGAKIDERCRNSRGDLSTTPHYRRRQSAANYRREHPQEWNHFKTELVRRLIQEELAV